jgi:DNA replication and repair protein RecF
MVMAEEAVRIVSLRAEFLDQLASKLTSIHSFFSPSSEILTARLRSQLYSGEALTATQTLEMFEKSIDRELASRQAHLGPHRDDVQLSFGKADQPAREFASQGQARSIVLALKFAVAELLEEKRGERPIILLDDLDSELDRDRRNLLGEMLSSSGGQVFITGTERSQLAKLDQQVDQQLKIEGGKIKEPRLKKVA